MANQRKTIVASAVNIAGDVLKAGIGLGALGVSRLNRALRGASATVGGGIQDARDAAGHVAGSAEALLVEFGQSFQGQAGVLAVDKTIEAKAIAKPEAKATKAPTKKASAPTSKSPAKAKTAAKPKAQAKPAVSAKPVAAKPAEASKTEGAEVKSDTPPKAAPAKTPAITKAAVKKPPAAKKTAKPAVQAATGTASDETPPPNKLH